jgi:hypothetical protein
MYFDFDFNRDSAFFKESASFKLIVDKLNNQERLKSSGCDEKLINATIKLWAECVLKNNLDINSHKIDTTNLISEQNSKDIFNIIGKIVWKAKEKRTDKEWKILREHTIINNYLQLELLYLYEDKIDIFRDLKKEFKTWKLAQELNQEIPVNSSKIKNKKL